MEQNPFQNNSESDDNDWEVSPEDLEMDDDSEEKESPKKRSLFETAKERTEREEEETEEKKSIFEKLLTGDEEKDTEESTEDDPVEGGFLNPGVPEEPLVESMPATPEEVTSEFESVVEGRIEQVDSEIVQESEPTRVGELLAESSLLEDVVDKIDEGQDPVNAIENATEEALENPIPDAGVEEVVTETQAPDAEVYSPDSIAPVSEAPVLNPLEAAEDDESTSTRLPTPPLVDPPSPMPPVPTAAELHAYASTESSSMSTDEELEPMNDSYNRDPKTGKVIAAGIVGYALGRRGGRKRTEEKLQPVINQQERTIDDLTDQLDTSEEAVRKAAATQQENEKKLREQQEHATAYQNDQEKIQEEIQAAHAETMKQEKAEFEEREKQLESELDQEVQLREEAERVATEAQQEEEIVKLREQQAAQQEFDEVAVVQNRADIEAEKRQEKAKTAAFAEQKAKEKARLQETKREIDANQLPLHKVLEIAEFIPMRGDMNLRQLYESRRIDAVNLRRVVNEFNRGGNFEKTLDTSLEAVELRSELKHEIKQDTSQYKTPEKAAHSVVDGIIAATGGDPNIVGQPSTSDATGTSALSASDEPVIITTEEPGLVISNGTAIVLGILAGIVVVLLILLYSGVF